MKIISRLIAILFIFFIIGFTALTSYSHPVNPADNKKIEFLIEKGQTIDQIANNLSAARLIRSRAVFKLMIFRFNLKQKIQAGYFYLAPSQTTAEIATSLTHATAKQVWITIPEGLRREEVANLIIDRLQAEKVPHQFDPDAFIRDTAKLEGHLFPDTYAFAPSVTTKVVIDKLTARFDQVTSELNLKPEQLSQVLTLASLVEREAGADSERPQIAAIIAKRAAAKWALQVDATVQYALATNHCRLRICDWWPKPLTKADLSVISPYNTYKNQGFPPGPIGNPGRASLSAAAHPIETKYWFYLHDLNGDVHYAATIEEHNKNICAYLKKDC